MAVAHDAVGATTWAEFKARFCVAESAHPFVWQLARSFIPPGFEVSHDCCSVKFRKPSNSNHISLVGPPGLEPGTKGL